ncbi:MAG: phosphatidylserine decarboxylase family protein [Bacteroidota bacterium]
MITKYGYNTIGVALIIIFVLIVISLLNSNLYVKWSLIVLSVVILIFTLNFFRDPERTTPDREKIVVSPADGTVMLIKEVVDNKFVNGDAWQISVFMSPLNVHVNRIPISGKVEYLRYVEGEYLVAYHDKADERNERSEIGIDSKYGRVLFTQVAGAVARRIVYDLNIGDTVKIGERFGMIKFGSRVDVIVDKSSWKPMVSVEQKVSAGETILFEKIDD